MNINFTALSNSDFPLLLKWLKSAHVKAWWDREINYKENLVKEKYASYVEGYKLEKGMKKPIYSYIIHVDNNPIGLFQIYNAYDFARNIPLIGLPKSLAAIDFFIGDTDYIGKGLGAEILKNFNILGYENILVDPDKDNVAAIKTYEKAGFKKVREYKESNYILMLKENI